MFDLVDANTVPLAYVAIGIIIGSFFSFHWSKKWAIILLCLGSALLGYFMASLDPFLNLWDEQQHALVAKHMAENPFYPTLYDRTLIGYDYKLWISNHVWIHKQPLFLWQMALFIKIFGAKVMAVRLPSVILHALLPYLVYRIGKSIRGELTGFIAAIFIVCANFPLELVAGRFPTDHNDMSFMFYITWSVMCWVEYQRTKDKKWLIWLGVAAGCAVLVKWLMGLLVYVIWFLVITALNKFKVWQIKNYFVMIKPFLISLAVFLPWQIYCFIRFPKEAKHELIASAGHFSNVVEGHVGAWNYHIDVAFEALYFPKEYLFAEGMPVFILIMVGIGIWRIKDNAYRLFFGIAIAFIYIFYSAAATKMLGFTVIAMPLVWLCIASVFEWIRELLDSKIKYKLITLVIIGALIFDPVKALMKPDLINQKHSLEVLHLNDNRQMELKELQVCQDLKEKYGDENLVIYNANITPVGFIPIMFHTDYLAYGLIPNEAVLQESWKYDYKVVVLDRNDLSDTLRNDSRIDIYPVY